MRNVFLWLVAALFAVACSSNPVYEQTGPEEVGPYTVSVLGDQVYHLQDCNKAYPAGEILNDSGKVTGYNNCSDMYLLVGGKEALLIDLSNDIKWTDHAADSLKKIISDRIGSKPLTITCTHNHEDHIGMLAAFTCDPKVKFAMPKADFEDRKSLFPTAQLTLFEEGYQFDLGGKIIESVMVPGHTHGSMVFFLKGADMAFTGDAVGSGVGVWIFSVEGFREFTYGILHLMQWIDNPEHGINKDKLILYGGHYHQREGLGYDESQEMGWSYMEDMDELVGTMKNGNPEFRPSNQNKFLDTDFYYGDAVITWNMDQYKRYKAEQ